MTSILAPIEKRTLIWLAHRLPAWVNSDHLTALALAAMLFAGLSYWLASVTPAGLFLVVACLAVNWFGDSLDGTLARVRCHQRPRYGFYVDHVVDAVGAVFLFGGMGLSGYMSPLVSLILLAAGTSRPRAWRSRWPWCTTSRGTADGRGAIGTCTAVRWRCSPASRPPTARCRCWETWQPWRRSCPSRA